MQCCRSSYSYIRFIAGGDSIPPLPLPLPLSPPHSGFYESAGLEAPSDEEMATILRAAVARSKEKHYHGDKGIEVLSPEG